MNPIWVLRTGRLILTPVGGSDLRDLIRLKSDPSVYAVMLGGVRSPTQATEDLALDVGDWARFGFGVWSIRENTRFVGIVALQHRADNRGVALRFALGNEAQGRGLAREAAAAALHFGHEQAGLVRIIAVAREDNFASRTVLGAIGMQEVDTFVQRGYRMMLYQSVRMPSVPADERGRKHSP